MGPGGGGGAVAAAGGASGPVGALWGQWGGFGVSGCPMGSVGALWGHWGCFGVNGCPMGSVGVPLGSVGVLWGQWVPYGASGGVWGSTSATGFPMGFPRGLWVALWGDPTAPPPDPTAAQGTPHGPDKMRIFRAERSYAVRTGKWYFEFEAVTTGEMRVGWARPHIRPDVELGADDLAYVFNGHRVSPTNGPIRAP